MIMEDSSRELLEHELEVEEQKIESDEKKIKKIFWIIFFLVILAVLNFAIIYLFIFKPVTTSSEGNKASTTPTILPTSTPIAIPTEPLNIAPTIIQSNIKEYFIPLGSGSGSANDWTDIDGLIANVDLGTFQNIKEINFEISVNVPTANQTVWVRLYNKTDKHPVWNSEVNANGTGGYMVSQPLIYDKGEKTYQVQIKTQLNYPANITQSRLHIKLN